MMAAALEKLTSLAPRLKSLALSGWQRINQLTQVDLKNFLPVFAGSLAFFVLLALLIPAPRPMDVSEEASSSHVLAGGTGEKHAENVQVSSRPFTDREKQAIATNDIPTRDPLTVAPVEALEEGSGDTRLPKIADDGRRPWFVYSRPFDHLDPRPRISVVVADLGLVRLISENAINDLPGPVTLIFNSDASTNAWMARARNFGHEVLLSVPMEPFDYPANDPGPGTLLTSVTGEENVKRLQNAMSKGTGYVGVTSLTGSHFTSSPEALKPVLTQAFSRGLLWYDARLVPLSSAYAVGQEMRMPSVRTDFRATADKSRSALDAMFQDAETSARHAGTVVVLVYPSPMSLQAITDWAKTLPEKGFALAPITAMVE